MRLRDIRKTHRLWKRRVGATLVIDPDAGGFGIEGGSAVHLLVRTPPGTTVRREATTTPHFAGRYDGQLRTTEDTARVAGWEVVLEQPLPKDEWPLPIERPPPMNLPR